MEIQSKYTRSAILVGLSLFILGILLLRDAHAYLDPGTGGYLIQLVIGFVAGGLFLLKMFWQRIMVFSRKLVRPKVQADDSDKDKQLAENNEI